MNRLKSITSFRPCIIMTLLFFLITIIISIKGVVCAHDKHKEIINDLPKQIDFEMYLTSLENTVDFCIRHKLYVDLNLEFGLFLIDVNLKPILKIKQKSIPSKTRIRLEQLLLKNDELSGYFHYNMVHKIKDRKKYNRDRRLSQIFYNHTTWPRPSDEFNVELLKQTKIYNPDQLEKIYGKWETYFNNVFDYSQYKPSPEESDRCIEYMARVPPLQSGTRRFQPNCLAPPRCKQRVKEGSEFGYGLSHRILFMVVARFSRGCTVFSEKEDIYKADKYCRRAFTEAQYIAINEFQLPDLVLEHIALCALFGHAQFLQNYWLKSVLQFQTSEGCFSEKMVDGKVDENEMKERDNNEWTIADGQDMMNGQCNGHFTAVAVASLAQALRYILETYY